jgi:hypothetical protein
MPMVALTGPPPYDVDVVLPLSLGVTFAAGVATTILAKMGIARWFNEPPVVVWRIACLAFGEASFFLTLWYQAQARPWQPFLAAYLAVAAVANWMVVGARGRAPFAWWLRLALFVTVYPVAQAGIVLVAFDPVVRLFARLFP